MTDVLTDAIQGGRINPLLLDKLDDDDRCLLAEVCHKAECPDIIAGFGIKPKRDDDYDRFRLLQGSIVAGDNSPQVLKEMKHLILRLMMDGRMTRSEGNGILADIFLLT